MEAGLFILDKKPVVFLDRDGVINEQALPHHYITSWNEFYVLPNVYDAIHLCNVAGYLVIIVSNQRGIAKGICSKEQINELHNRMQQDFEQHGAHIDGIYICPHDEGKCDCRKPKPGLFFWAERELLENREIQIDKKKSWMIGDFESDIFAGIAYGVRTAAVGNHYQYFSESCKEKTNLVAKDLYQAINKILNITDIDEEKV